MHTASTQHYNQIVPRRFWRDYGCPQRSNIPGTQWIQTRRRRAFLLIAVTHTSPKTSPCSCGCQRRHQRRCDWNHFPRRNRNRSVGEQPYCAAAWSSWSLWLWNLTEAWLRARNGLLGMSASKWNWLLTWFSKRGIVNMNYSFPTMRSTANTLTLPKWSMSPAASASNAPERIQTAHKNVYPRGCTSTITRLWSPAAVWNADHRWKMAQLRHDALGLLPTNWLTKTKLIVFTDCFTSCRQFFYSGLSNT